MKSYLLLSAIFAYAASTSITFLIPISFGAIFFFHVQSTLTGTNEQVVCEPHSIFPFSSYISICNTHASFSSHKEHPSALTSHVSIGSQNQQSNVLCVYHSPLYIDFDRTHLRSLLWSRLVEKPLRNNTLPQVYPNVSIAHSFSTEAQIAACLLDISLLLLEIETHHFFLAKELLASNIYNADIESEFCFLPPFIDLFERTIGSQPTTHSSLDPVFHTSNDFILAPTQANYDYFLSTMDHLCQFSILESSFELKSPCSAHEFTTLYYLLKNYRETLSLTFLEITSLLSLFSVLPKEKVQIWREYVEYRSLAPSSSPIHPVLYRNKALLTLLPMFVSDPSLFPPFMDMESTTTLEEKNEFSKHYSKLSAKRPAFKTKESSLHYLQKSFMRKDSFSEDSRSDSSADTTPELKQSTELDLPLLKTKSSFLLLDSLTSPSLYQTSNSQYSFHFLPSQSFSQLRDSKNILKVPRRKEYLASLRQSTSSLSTILSPCEARYTSLPFHPHGINQQTLTILQVFTGVTSPKELHGEGWIEARDAYQLVHEGLSRSIKSHPTAIWYHFVIVYKQLHNEIINFCPVEMWEQKTKILSNVVNAFYSFLSLSYQNLLYLDQSSALAYKKKRALISMVHTLSLPAFDDNLQDLQQMNKKDQVREKEGKAVDKKHKDIYSMVSRSLTLFRRLRKAVSNVVNMETLEKNSTGGHGYSTDTRRSRSFLSSEKKPDNSIRIVKERMISLLKVFFQDAAFLRLQKEFRLGNALLDSFNGENLHEAYHGLDTALRQDIKTLTKDYAFLSKYKPNQLLTLLTILTSNISSCKPFYQVEFNTQNEESNSLSKGENDSYNAIIETTENINVLNKIDDAITITNNEIDHGNDNAKDLDVMITPQNKYILPSNNLETIEESEEKELFSDDTSSGKLVSDQRKSPNLSLLINSLDGELLTLLGRTLLIKEDFPHPLYVLNQKNANQILLRFELLEDEIEESQVVEAFAEMCGLFKHQKNDNILVTIEQLSSLMRNIILHDKEKNIIYNTYHLVNHLTVWKYAMEHFIHNLDLLFD